MAANVQVLAARLQGNPTPQRSCIHSCTIHDSSKTRGHLHPLRHDQSRWLLCSYTRLAMAKSKSRKQRCRMRMRSIPNARAIHNMESNTDQTVVSILRKLAMHTAFLSPPHTTRTLCLSQASQRWPARQHPTPQRSS